jgi:hypothetical protein
VSAPARTAVRPARVPDRLRPAPSPALRLVPRRRQRAARTPYVVFVVVLLVVGLLGLLALNTLLAEGSFQVHRLQADARSLSNQEQALREQVSALQSPANLSAQAQAMGMVPGGPPVFLRLEDGAILGQPVPGKALPVAPTTSAATPAAPAKPAPGGTTP